MAPQPEQPRTRLDTAARVLPLATIAIVGAFAFLRFFLFDGGDPYSCLLTTGSWLDPGTYRNWQPDGCMMRKYTPSDASNCLRDRQVIVVGDSVARQTFEGLVTTLDPTVDLRGGEKHSDKALIAGGVRLNYIWDPFLNDTRTVGLLAGDHAAAGLPRSGQQVPALAVFGAGLWHLRTLEFEDAQRQWQETLETVWTSNGRLVADEIAILPVEQPIQSKLRADRALTLTSEHVDVLNSALEAQALANPDRAFVPTAFNRLVQGAESQTDDGLHYLPEVLKARTNILLNARCNAVKLAKFPFDNTCCFQYPVPLPTQALVLLILAIWGPLAWYAHTNPSAPSWLHKISPRQKTVIPLMIVSFTVLYAYMADRTSIFLKMQKQFETGTFTLLSLIALIAGIATMSPAEKDLGFLNRDQTDEWKGWMQIAILIYHFCGASTVSGIYNPIRILVASYVWMTGFGHFHFYYKKADFGFARVASVLVRLNLLTVFLAVRAYLLSISRTQYAMDTDWLSYYFSPLVTMWFLVIWTIMRVGSQWNKSSAFMLFKIAVAAGGLTVFFRLNWPLAFIFNFINRVFATEWIAKEWAFRTVLDLYIPFWGMLGAMLQVKAAEHKWAEQPWWPRAKSGAIIASALAMLGWGGYALRVSKFDYNAAHPLISVLPVVAFAVLRNATPHLRSTSSRFFAFFGQCSLETFVLQFHIWLAGDTKGLLLVLPTWMPWLLNLAVSSVIFVYLSHHVSNATGELTSWILTQPKKPAAPNAAASNGAYIPLTGTAEGATKEVTEPSPAPSRTSQLLNDLRLRCLLILAGLWFLNVIYGHERPPTGHLLPTH